MPIVGYRPGGKYQSQLRRALFASEALSSGKCGYLVAPKTAGDPLTDLSLFARGAGSLKNGAALGAGLIEESAAAYLDGTNDLIETPWLTRINQLLNPSFETNTTGWTLTATSWTSGTLTRSELPFAGSDGKWIARVQATKDASATLRTATLTHKTAVGAVVPGNKYVASVLANVIDNTPLGVQVFINWYTSASVFLSASTAGTLFTGTGITTLSSPAVVAPATASIAEIVIQFTSSTTGDTVDMRFDNVLLEEAESVGSYFPTIAQLASGEAGWSGTAYSSASDIGPFARGTKRTFIGVANRTDTSAAHALFGGSAAANAPSLNIANGNLNVVWDPGTGATGSWTAAWPATGQVVAWALVFDEAGDTATLYINGVSQGAKAVTGAYSNPGALKLGARAASSIAFKGSMLPFTVLLGSSTAAEVAAYGAVAANLTPNTKHLTTVEVKEAGRIPKLSALMDGNAPGASGDGQPVRGVIYGPAGALLGESEEVVIPALAASEWVDFVFPDAGGIPVDVGTYEFGLLAGTGTGMTARVAAIEGVGTRAIGADTYGSIITEIDGAVTLPAASIKVSSTTGFDPAGTFTVQGQVVTYTSVDGTHFLGASGGAGVVADNEQVQQSGASTLRNQPEAPASEEGEFAIFATYFTEPTVPDIDDIQIARYPFSYAQRVLGEEPPMETSLVASLTWHGTVTSPERGSFALVQRDGRFTDLIGERVRVSTFLGRSVNAYVLGVADLNEEDDLSVTRRLFLALAPLATDSLNVRVEILSASESDE